MVETTPVALTIAGSDSGGGAGIQSDLRVFSRLGVFGTSVITAVTAQNLDQILSIEGLAADIVVDQLRAVVSGFPVAAVKTGMLWSADVVHAVATVLDEAGNLDLVIDPVLVATTGVPLVEDGVLDVLCETLIPRCSLLTPNLDEAAALLGQRHVEERDIEDAARELVRRHRCSVLLKGGHLSGEPVDVLCLDDGPVIRHPHERLVGVNSHGTGCILSAAITAFLARGADLESACSAAIDFVSSALASPHQLASGARVAGIERAASMMFSFRRRP